MRQRKISPSITNRDAPSLNKYLQEICKIDMISPEEEARLAQKVRDGDQAALERLVKTNLRFVVSIAKQYQNLGISLGDLINEGNMGLIKAAHRFDGSQGFKFISYAVWWIRRSILIAVAEQSRIVHLPLNQLDALSKVRKASLKLEQHYEREPSRREIAEYLETTVDKVSDSLRNSIKHVSIDSPFKHGEENTLLDVLSNNSPATDNGLIRESVTQEIMQYIGILSDRESQVIKLFFGLEDHYPLTLDDISEKFCLTRERVRQIKEKALERLSQHMRVFSFTA